MYKLTENQIRNAVEIASLSLEDYCIKNNIHYAVVGSSGGLDSAVTLKLATIAANNAKARGYDLTIVGLIMPCYSSDDSIRLGKLAIEAAGAEMIKIPLDLVYDSLNTFVLDELDYQIINLLRKKGQGSIDDWEKSATIAQGNIKARLRMMLGTYHTARMLNGLVLSTDNLSEFYMGFWTLHGDVGDYGMIQQVFKGLELYDIARYLGVPQEIIDAKPDDGLGVANGGDEAQLGAPYEDIDKIMLTFLQNGYDPLGDEIYTLDFPMDYEPELVRQIINRAIRTTYKRLGTINLTRKELGLPAIEEIDR